VGILVGTDGEVSYLDDSGNAGEGGKIFTISWNNPWIGRSCCFCVEHVQIGWQQHFNDFSGEYKADCIAPEGFSIHTPSSIVANNWCQCYHFMF
jgi:hypothetical protein